MPNDLSDKWSVSCLSFNVPDNICSEILPLISNAFFKTIKISNVKSLQAGEGQNLAETGSKTDLAQLSNVNHSPLQGSSSCPRAIRYVYMLYFNHKLNKFDFNTK